MADVTGAFELRKLQVRFTRTPAGGTQEDDEYVTWHFGKVSGGGFDSNWLTADYTAVENALATWWATFKTYVPAFVVLREYRWFKSGPFWEPADAPNVYNPVTRSTLVSVPGTSSVNPLMPPQVSITLSKITSLRKRWGRIYVPGPLQSGILITDGRIGAATQSTMLSTTVTFCNACRAAGLRPVVFSRGKGAYVTPKGAHIGGHDATAYEIVSLRIDNLFDVLRTRRWSEATSRTTTVLT